MAYSTSVFVYTQRQIVVLLLGNSVRKYMPVYAKPLTLHKGVDNRIQFQFLDQAQKPVDITGKSITCRILNYNGTQILIRKALDVDLGLTGIASLNLNAADIEDVDAQKAYYSLEIPSGTFDYPVFVDQNAGARGDMNIVNSVLPSFVPSQEVTIPTGQPFPNISNSSGNTNLVYFTSIINTQDNPVLTIQTKYEDYYGNVSILGSSTVDGDFYTIQEDNELANVTETKGYTIHGYHPFVKVEFTSNSGAVTNILAR
jgi:hypothetical protein